MAMNNIGLDAPKTKKVVEKLNKLLADYQIHYQNLRGFHWNVKGRCFFTLHAKFEEYYDAAAERADLLAERILQLDGAPLHTFKDYLDNAAIKVYKDVSDGDKCVANVLKDVKSLVKKQREIMELAEKAGDQVTIDLMVQFSGEDEKNIWMLTAYIS